MGTSPDVGGRSGIGRPLEPMLHEREATADVQVAKQGLALVQNTLEIPISKLGGGDQYRHNCSSMKPTIPANVLVGVTHKEEEEPDQLAEQTYEELLEELPLSLSMELKQENRKPAYERDAPFLVLEQMLRFCSKALAFLRTCSAIKLEDHIGNTSKNISLSVSCLWKWIKNIQSLIQVFKEEEKEHDDDIELITRLHANRDILEDLIKKVATLLRLSETDKQYEALLTLAEETKNLNDLFDHQRIPYATALLGDAIKTLHILIHAFAQTNSAPIFFVLGMACDTWEKNKNSQTGIGASLDKLLKTMSEAPIEASPIESYHALHLMEMMLLIFNGLVAEAAGATKPGKTSRKEVVTGKVRQIRTFAYKLASSLIATSNVLPAIGLEAFKLLSLKEESQQVLVTSTTLIAMNVPILAGLKGDEAIKGSEFLIAGMGDVLQRHLVTIKTFFEGGDKETRKISIALRQAVLALTNKEDKGYFEALEIAAAVLELKLDNLEGDSESLVTFMMMLLEVCHRLDEQAVMSSFIRQSA